MENKQETSYQEQVAKLYAEASASKYNFAKHFKQRWYPADPFETGILVGAELLSIEDLVTVMQAARALIIEGNTAFTNSLILFRGENSTPMVRVDPDWINRKKFRTIEICEYIRCFLFEDAANFAEQRRKILCMKNIQLQEYLVEADKALNFQSGDEEPTLDKCGEIDD